MAMALGNPWLWLWVIHDGYGKLGNPLVSNHHSVCGVDHFEIFEP
jgi:hypothetical protein